MLWLLIQEFKKEEEETDAQVNKAGFRIVSTVKKTVKRLQTCPVENASSVK